MSEIPADVMETAKRVCEPSFSGASRVDDAQHILDVARAIMVERERCARAVENWKTDLVPGEYIVNAIYRIAYRIRRGEQPPNAPDTAHASTSPGPLNCSIRKRFQNMPYPRTCERCGLGPCPFFHNDGSVKL